MKKIILSVLVMVVSLLQAAETINVACVGDSITVGYPGDASQSYPSQLQALFDDRDGVGAYKVGRYGVSGRTLRNDGDFPYRADFWYTASLASKPDIVIIMLGANDAKVGLNWNVAAKDGTRHSISIFNADYVSLIDTYRALSPTPKILVCTPIPVCTVGDGNTFGISDTAIADEICPAIRSIVTAPSDVGMIELNAIFPHDQTAAYAPVDKVHPSATGYGFIAEKIYDSVKSTLATP